MSRYYVGLDVHEAGICVAVLKAAGKLVMESVVETGAATVLDSLKGLRGQVEVTFEEGTHAALRGSGAGGLAVRALQVVVRGAVSEGAAAGTGAGDGGAQDRGRHSGRVEGG